jgi:hypothetical protein
VFTLHAAFIQIFNTTNHWAHRERQDGARRSVAVLAWQRRINSCLSPYWHKVGKEKQPLECYLFLNI